MSRAIPMGTMFGGWEVVRYIGSGGSGEVYEVHSLDDRRAALKWVPPWHPNRTALEAMLLDEVSLGQHLGHPNIVEVFGMLEGPQGSKALLLELMDGGSLRNAMNSTVGGAVPIPIVLRIGIKACEALDFAHRCVDQRGRHLGIVHRDISPENLLFSSRGAVKVGDFGISLARERHQATVSGAIKGKLAYLSPEQAMRRSVDARADVYALGLTLAEAASGESLAKGLTVSQRLIRAAQARIDPRGILNGLPEELLRIIRGATAARLEDRFPSAAHMADAITGCGLRIGSTAELAHWLASLSPPERVGRLDHLLDDLGW